jgi:uncharacterized integral membrane protein
MTLKRTFNWVVGLPLAILAIAFAVANRQWITVSFDPISRDAPRIFVNMPQWVLLFMGIFIGLIVGWIAAWWNQGKHRRAVREARLELLKAQSEHERFKREAATRNVPVSGDASL